MNIKDAKEQIKNAVTAYLTKDKFGRYAIPVQKQRPIFLLGAPGIGKTAIMEQIASELGIGLLSYSMTHHTRQSALGLPLIEHRNYQGKEYAISEYTMSEIIASVYDLMEQTGIRNGILFLDEINCVSETLAPVMLQFLQYKIFGKHALPAGWVVVTAGNPPEYNHSVREFDIATWDRVKKIEITPDFDTWKEFAYETGIHSAILTYLEIRKSNFYQIETTVDGKSFVTARGWDDLSQMLRMYEANGLTVDENLISQYLQNRKIAQDFAVYYDLYTKYREHYQITEILDGKASDEIKDRANRADFDERYALLGLLLESVMNDMKQSLETEAVLTSLLHLLRQVKCSDDPRKKLEELQKIEQEEYTNGIQSKCLSQEQQTQKLQILEILEQEKAILSAHPEMGFKAVKADFDDRVHTFQGHTAQTIRRTKNLFRFCDEVFPQGQEIAILVTELTIHPGSAYFIAAHKIQEYFDHDKEFLFHQRELDMLREIQELDLDQEQE